MKIHHSRDDDDDDDDDDNNPLALQPIESLILPIECWPHIHLSADRGEQTSNQFGDGVSSAH